MDFSRVPRLSSAFSAAPLAAMHLKTIEFYFRQNLPCLEDCLRKAVLKGGVPAMTTSTTALRTRPGSSS